MSLLPHYFFENQNQNRRVLGTLCKVTSQVPDNVNLTLTQLFMRKEGKWDSALSDYEETKMNNLDNVLNDEVATGKSSTKQLASRFLSARDTGL